MVSLNTVTYRVTQPYHHNTAMEPWDTLDTRDTWRHRPPFTLHSSSGRPVSSLLLLIATAGIQGFWPKTAKRQGSRRQNKHSLHCTFAACMTPESIIS